MGLFVSDKNEKELCSFIGIWSLLIVLRALNLQLKFKLTDKKLLCKKSSFERKLEFWVAMQVKYLSQLGARVSGRNSEYRLSKRSTHYAREISL